jgi:rhamnosyltransferase subunit B
MNQTPKKIIFATWGSYGDIHPFMALALEMQRRGYRSTIATLGLYREKIEAAGLQFIATRPDTPGPDSEASKEIIRRAMDLREGPRFVVRDLLATHARDTYADTLAAVQAEGGADLLVSHAVPMVAPLVAEVTGVKWVSAVLSPISLLSAHDPPTPPEFPALRSVLAFHPFVAKSFISLIKQTTKSWVAPIYELRKELGLPPGPNPIFDAQHSPRQVLALFSRVLGGLQPDQPANTLITGFPFYDLNDQQPVSTELIKFLGDGEPPILFTLGSSAVRVGHDFFRISIEVARRLGRRALLLVSDTGELQLNDLSTGIGVFNYAPHSLVMPRACAIVHQGGIGTTGQALRAGRPMLIVPYGQDQPDNARRCAKLGVGLVLPSRRYSVEQAVRQISELLTNPSYREHAAETGLKVQAEKGTENACDALERVLRT